MAADSRFAGLEPPEGDSAEKIVEVGSTGLCGFSGMLRFTRSASDARKRMVLRASTFELPAIIRQSLTLRETSTHGRFPEHFAEAVWGAVSPVWRRFASGLDEPFGRLGVRCRLADMVFLDRSSDGCVTCFTVRLQYSTHQIDARSFESRLEPPVIKGTISGAVSRFALHCFGMTSCIGEIPGIDFIHFQQAPANAIVEVFASAQRSKRCRSAIGGPVDIAVINRSGRYWIQSKRPSSNPLLQPAGEADTR